MKKNSASYTNNWSQLPYDVLVRIFTYLNIMDLVSGVSGVSRSWRAASSDPMLWKETDFNSLESFVINIPREINVITDRMSSNNYLGILRRALDLSRGSVSHLSFHYRVLLKNEHLLCAAQRHNFSLRKLNNILFPAWLFRNSVLVSWDYKTPNLKQLVLSSRNLFSIVGFKEAMKNWKELESLTVTCAQFPYFMMECIGTHCKNLSELAINCNLDLELALAIVTNIPQLKALNLRHSSFYKEALLHLMKSLKHLEVLNISHTLQLEKVWYGNHQFRMNVHIDKEITENGSRIGKFINCQNQNCVNSKHPHGKIKHRYLIGI